MNLLDHRVTPPAVAFAAVAELAGRAGARVEASEIVGLVPAAALAGVDPADLRLRGDVSELLLENRLARAMDSQLEETPMSPQHRLGEHGWLDAYAAPTVTPGGGSASAVAGALGCALLAMAARIGARKAEPEAAATLDRLAGDADRLRADLVEQERTDAGAYERMVATVRAARATEGDPGATRAAEAARADATEVPLATAELAAEGLRLATELAGMAMTRTASDQLVAAHLLRAGLEGGLSTVTFNLRRMAPGPVRDDLSARAGRLEDARRAATDLTGRLATMVGEP